MKKDKIKRPRPEADRLLSVRIKFKVGKLEESQADNRIY
jgi:hypothetical protein